jgi:hypothetical protein
MRSILLALTAIGCGVTCALPGATSTPFAGAATAPKVFVAVGGADGNPCTRSRPCAGLDRAYRVAKPGTVVEIGAGTYPPQTILAVPAKGYENRPCSPVRLSRCVVFRPAAGARVTIQGDLVMFGSNAIFRGSKRPYNFRLGRNLISDARRGASTSHHVYFENLDGAAFTIGPNHHITIKGGDWGPNYICGSDRGVIENKIGPDGNILNQWPHHVVLDGLYIHDQNSHNLDACHFGGLFLISGHHLTIRNSVFSQNVVYQILIQDFSNPTCCGMKFGQFRDVTIENNWFGPPVEGLAPHGRGHTINDRQPELQFDARFGSWVNWLIRFNSFHNGFSFAAGRTDPTFRNVRVIGNIGEQPECFRGTPGVSWTSNAWRGGTCGRSDVAVGRLPYVKTQIGFENYHLTSGPARDLVRGKGRDFALSRDIDGQRRPRGRGRDAGSDER